MQGSAELLAERGEVGPVLRVTAALLVVSQRARVLPVKVNPVKPECLTNNQRSRRGLGVLLPIYQSDFYPIQKFSKS